MDNFIVNKNGFGDGREIACAHGDGYGYEESTGDG